VERHRAEEKGSTFRVWQNHMLMLERVTEGTLLTLPVRRPQGPVTGNLHPLRQERKRGMGSVIQTR